MKLLCPKEDVRAQKVLLTAAFADLRLDAPAFVLGKDDKKEDFKKKSPLGRVPVLETDAGCCVVGSGAACRYLARLRVDKALYGDTVTQAAQVDAWLDFCANELEVPILAWASQGAAVADKAKADVMAAVTVLNNHLRLRTYLVGERVTIADISVCAILGYLAKKQLAAGMCGAFPEVLRWLETICNKPCFKKVCGECPTTCAAKAASSSSCCSSSKPAAAPAASAAADEPAPAPKPKCELDNLPPSPLDLNEWKRQYSNTPDLRGKAMPWLWQNFDAAGYCFYYMKYEKLDGECTVPFVTSNQLGGFLQRIDNAFRKYAFGVINVVGQGSSFDIQGVWMFRGHDIPPMMKEHPSFEYHTWRRLDQNVPADKALIEDYFCEEKMVEKTPIADCKVYK